MAKKNVGGRPPGRDVPVALALKVSTPLGQEVERLATEHGVSRSQMARVLLAVGARTWLGLRPARRALLLK